MKKQKHEIKKINLEKVIPGFFIMLFLAINCGLFSGCSGGNTPNNEITEDVRTTTDPVESVFSPEEGYVGYFIGETTNQILSNLNWLVESIEQTDLALTGDDILTEKAVFQAGQNTVQELQTLLDRINKGEEVTLTYELDGDPETVEEVVVNRNDLIEFDFLTKVYQDYLGIKPQSYVFSDESYKASGESGSSSSLNPGDEVALYNVGLICENYKNIGIISKGIAVKTAQNCQFQSQTIPNPFYISPDDWNYYGSSTFYTNEPEIEVLPSLNPLSCGAYVLNSLFQSIITMGEIACMPFPTHLDELNLYPDRPCVKTRIDPEEDAKIELVLEGKYSNQIDGGALLEEAIGAVAGHYMEPLFELMGELTSPAVELAVSNSITSGISSKIAESAKNLGLPSDLKFNAGVSDVTLPVIPTKLSWFVDGDIDTISNSLEFAYSEDLLTNLPAYYLEDKGGFGRNFTLEAVFIDKTIEDDTVESEVVLSQERDMRSSTPPTLVDFDIPNFILGGALGWHASGSAENSAAEEWLNNPDLKYGFITIKDEEEDLLWAYFSEGNDIGAQGFIYGTQTNEEIELSYPKSNYNTITGFISTIPGAGEKTVSFRARDLCGNDVILVKEHTFNWEACPGDSFTCYLAEDPEDEFINNGYNIESGLDKSAGKINFYEAIDDFGMYQGEGSYNWDTLMDSDGNLSFGGRSWVEILKEEDALK